MKKIIYIIIALTIIIFGIQFFDFLMFDESKVVEIPQEILATEIIEKEKVLNPSLIETLENYLITLPELAWQTKEGSSNICVFENLDLENELFPLSLWVYCSEYRISETGEIEKLSGASVPLLLDYPNELSFYNPEQFTYKIPRDGVLFSKDVKEMFSEDVQVKIFKHDSIDRLQIEMDEKINALN
ncbi:hypothetical protein KJ603_00505 [Patescibacteria group bacterium]|nr:hypothetical protein [Patescibacteria group bacterium]